MSKFNGGSLNFNAAHRLKRSIDQLIGICSGIAADGVVNDQEIAFLSTWLSENGVVCTEFPGKEIAARISEVMADGVITDEERDELLGVLQQISGNRFIETGSAQPDGAAIPADIDPNIVFSGKHFCFTGKFAFGIRRRCEEAVIKLGGHADGDVTRALDYLVLGIEVSEDWKHQTYGRKIERALKLREEGFPLVIVREFDWKAALEV